MNARASHDEIAATLYLQAVLPAFAELSDVCARAKALTQDWDCSVGFSAPGQKSPTIVFQRNKIEVSGSGFRPAISLFFLSSKQLVKQFTGHGLSVPLPVRGWFRFISLIKFIRLGKILEEELEQHPSLLLGVALRSINPLLAHDPFAREIMAHCPDGLAEFAVPSTELFGWVEWKNGAATFGRGHARRSPDVTISFCDEKTALAALRGELDEFAAIGSGALRVIGLVPFADALGAVMARAELYVERTSK